MHLADYERMPSVGAAMTPFPHSVGPDASVLEVERVMNAHRIRHVPVQEDGRVLGVVSERDLHQLVHASLPDARQGPAAHPPPAAPRALRGRDDAPLDEVADEMARQHVGSAAVVRHGKLAGIFSTVDACRLLAEFLRDRFPEGPVAA